MCWSDHFIPTPWGLTNAFPDLARARDQLVPIPGSPPDLRNPPPGCRFAPRCPFAIDRCLAEDPQLVDVGSGHQASCWRSDAVVEMRSKAKEAATWSPSSL